jgi:hypothetical protein
MPTATEHDPLPLPEYGSMDKDIAARVRHLRRHNQVKAVRRVGYDFGFRPNVVVWLACLVFSAYVTLHFIAWLSVPYHSPYANYVANHIAK